VLALSRSGSSGEQPTTAAATAATLPLAASVTSTGGFAFTGGFVLRLQLRSPVALDVQTPRLEPPAFALVPTWPEPSVSAGGTADVYLNAATCPPAPVPVVPLTAVVPVKEPSGRQHQLRAALPEALVDRLTEQACLPEPVRLTVSGVKASSYAVRFVLTVRTSDPELGILDDVQAHGLALGLQGGTPQDLSAGALRLPVTASLPACARLGTPIIGGPDVQFGSFVVRLRDATGTGRLVAYVPSYDEPLYAALAGLRGRICPGSD
jgi:hypothetical protein